MTTITSPDESELESNAGPRTSGVSMRAVAQIAVFAALIGALGLMGAIAVPGLVPITAQTLGVMLAGAVLGPWRGAASVSLLLLMVTLGLPLLSGGRGGLGVFVGPSVGYLIGWIVGAMVIGLIVHGVRGHPRIKWPRVLLGAMIGGIGVIYLFGIPAQAVVTGLDLRQTALTSLAFLPADVIKAGVTVVVTMALWRAYPRAFHA